MDSILRQFEEEIATSLYGEIIETKPTTNLKEIFELLSANKLKKIYNNLLKKQYFGSIKNIDKKMLFILTKKEIITNFYKLLLNEDILLLNKIIKNNGVLKISKEEIIFEDHLINNGIIYPFKSGDNNYYLVLPNEISTILKEIDIEVKKQIEINNNINDLIISMINLYGVISFEEFIELYKNYYGKYFEKEDMNFLSLKRRNGLSIISNTNKMYFVKENLTFFYENELDLLIEIDKGQIIRKNITLEDLLKYKNNLYYVKDKWTEEFINYLICNGLEKTKAIDLVALVIYNLKRIRQIHQKLFKNDFLSFGFEITKDNYVIIMNYINRINDNVVSFGNKGYTNKEILLGDYQVYIPEIDNFKNISIKDIKVSRV